MAGLFGSGCEEAYQSVFQDDPPETWCWLGYQGNSLVPQGTGTGGLAEMTKQVEDNQILYGLLRMNKTDDGGDSKRVKFVFLTWVGENASPLKKGKVTVHKKQCSTLFKGYHIEKQLYDREALDGLEHELDSDLRKAGGANYDLGNTRTGVQAGQSQALKSMSKKFFEEREKETNITSVVYDVSPLKQGITACDLGGRSFVASQTEAKKNIVGFST